jgi:hypothetical protein
MCRITLILFLIASPWLSTAVWPVAGPPAVDPTQVNPQILSPTPTYTFGSQINFQGNLLEQQAVRKSSLYISARGQDIQIFPVSINQDGTWNLTIPLEQNTLRPFTRVYYWYKLVLNDGTDYTSPSFWFDYIDNRFTWQTLENNLFRIHWIEGDSAFGQSVLDVAQAGFNASQGLLPVALPASPVDIYVYSHAKDLQKALEMGGMPWVTGHASPDLGVVLVSLPKGPDQRLQMEQQVPHELFHILVYQMVGSAYARLPAWLVEGLASVVELYPNSDYSHTLQIARQNGTLIPIASLCQSFPRDASNAFLAYAESESFVRFISKRYGVTGIQSMIQNYQYGMGCSEGASASVGSPLNTLDFRWRQEVLGVDTASLAFDRLSPYLLAGVLVLIPGLITGFYFHRKNGN